MCKADRSRELMVLGIPYNLIKTLLFQEHCTAMGNRQSAMAMVNWQWRLRFKASEPFVSSNMEPATENW